jgi:hypothetical protein
VQKLEEEERKKKEEEKKKLQEFEKNIRKQHK